jgi:hypothetical protein
VIAAQRGRLTGEIEDILAELPEEYGELFGTSNQPPLPPPSPRADKLQSERLKRDLQALDKGERR